MHFADVIISLSSITTMSHTESIVIINKYLQQFT